MSKKCKYAGDPIDPECSKCNGVTMEHEGQMLVCETRCGGFEPEQQQEIKPATPQVQETVNEVQNVKKDFKSKCTTTLIGCKSAVSKEINGVWYKFEAWEELSVPDGKKVDIEQERNNLFDKLGEEVDKQVMQVLKMDSGV